MRVHDPREQISKLLQRAAELRAQGEDIRRRLQQIASEIARLTGSPGVEGKRERPIWALPIPQASPGTETSDTQM